MSEDAVLSALRVVLPVDTTVAAGSVYIRQGVTPKAASWPVLLLSVPLAEEEQQTMGGPGMGSYQTIHVAHALYMDQWIEGPRTFEEIEADAAAQLQIMQGNVRLNPQLIVDGVAHCMEVRKIQRRAPVPPDSAQTGFPVIQAELVIWCADFMVTYTPG